MRMSRPWTVDASARYRVVRTVPRGLFCFSLSFFGVAEVDHRAITVFTSRHTDHSRASALSAAPTHKKHNEGSVAFRAVRVAGRRWSRRANSSVSGRLQAVSQRCTTRKPRAGCKTADRAGAARASLAVARRRYRNRICLVKTRARQDCPNHILHRARLECTLLRKRGAV